MPKYENYRYIYPPRPKNTIPDYELSSFDDGTFIAQPKLNGSNCVIFTNGSRFIVMNRHGQRLTNFQLNEIELKEGCEVILKRTKANVFSGKTGIKTCPSELRGARYATSIVTLTENSILSWDQGFDEMDKQVWGAENGGYEFIKY